MKPSASTRINGNFMQHSSRMLSCDLSSKKELRTDDCHILDSTRHSEYLNILLLSIVKNVRIFISIFISSISQTNPSFNLCINNCESSKAVTEMDLCVRSGGTTLLLLVNGCVISIFIQFLGHHISFRIPRNQRRNAPRLVLPRLLLRLFIPNRYTISLSNGISGGWRAANRFNETASTLYEFNNVLYRLPVLTAIRFFIFEHRIQFDTTVVSISQDLSLLGVHGSNGTSYKLSKSFSLHIPHTLFTRYFPLERLSISYYL